MNTGLMDVWLYSFKSPNEEKLFYWIFHLKYPLNPEDRRTNWIFYDPEKEDWKTLDLKKFYFNNKNCERVNDYEKLSRAWKNFLQDTNPPFALTDIVSKQLQVWSWYTPLNGKQDNDTPSEMLVWTFHLKIAVNIKTTPESGVETTTSNWICYSFCQGNNGFWLPLNIFGEHKANLINDNVAHPVPFEVFIREWNLAFIKRCNPPFKITDIMERKSK